MTQFVIGEPGRMASEVKQGLPPADWFAPDVSLSEYETVGHQIRAASIRGLLHRHRGQPCQDAFAVAWNQATLTAMVAVADGVGSRKHSHQASSKAVAIAASVWGERALAPASLIEVVNDEIRALQTAGQLPPEIATTLTLATVSSEGLVETAWIGDSPVWLMSDGRWNEVTRDVDEDIAFDNPVTSLPTRTLQVASGSFKVRDGVLFVMTDGVGKALRHSSEVRSSLADWWATPPDLPTFSAQVAFARRSFMDDRTVVAFWTKAGKQKSRSSGEASVLNKQAEA